ncbi:MAG TPA: 3-oxoacyl-ACP reductase FabG [Bacteroidales bacterium]|jgi:3-oxoacyl-[acyl-carrier protein] reductase|nr:3-oxoacyl-ACP reductase FabG [Bacteroidales bacterium]MCZ2417995.1 3-oxoacyl-ACP reductase FabG [Burkholderiales bacterium]OQC57884.1 MAG: 3-oxoacyl-(acyl-carrier-protein) reductase FabG [Bacteroidetes bacterium ADurb.Bin013]MBP8999468.1 3-oxoacyl-ACP reductase FabG [Bacteroidales bacterium]MBV6455633.1 3-oxoacyl-[acyl-carrier-protein] reductase FabG [Bacteroidales bacterium]
MKYALVTGGSRGIGRAICVALAKEGYSVIVNYARNREAAEKTVEMIASEGGMAQLLQFNVASKEEVDNALDAWDNEHPGEYISVLVNNAGIRQDNLMIFMQDEQWNNVLETNLFGFFYVTRRVLKNMLTRRYGRIVNVTSLSGLTGLPGQTNYAASKAGLIGATRALAMEVAPRKVTVNCVAPGFIETDMTSDINQDEHKGRIPAGRFGKPAEVAAAVVFFAGENASYITGQVLSVNGGLYT